MNKNTALIILPVLSTVWFLITVIWGGIAYESYDHVSQFISELGATGTSTGTFVNYFGFIPTQLLILLFVLIATIKVPKTTSNILGLLFITIYTLSLGLAAIFPCDFECRPQTPATAHNIHVLSAIPAYLSGALAIFVISFGLNGWMPSKQFKTIGIILGFTILICFLNLDPNSNIVGLIQRTLEASIFIWLILFGYHIKLYCDHKKMMSK